MTLYLLLYGSIMLNINQTTNLYFVVGTKFSTGAVTLKSHGSVASDQTQVGHLSFNFNLVLVFVSKLKGKHFFVHRNKLHDSKRVGHHVQVVGFLLVSFIKYQSPGWISYITVCARPEDGFRCRQGIQPKLKHKLFVDVSAGRTLGCRTRPDMSEALGFSVMCLTGSVRTNSKMNIHVINVFLK